MLGLPQQLPEEKALGTRALHDNTEFFPHRVHVSQACQVAQQDERIGHFGCPVQRIVQNTHRQSIHVWAEYLAACYSDSATRCGLVYDAGYGRTTGWPQQLYV